MLAGVKKIYFIGIGGIGMSAVAGLARAQGFEVEGSEDRDVYDPAKKVLDDAEIPYKIGYSSGNLQNADLVVATAAVDETNPEIQKAKELGLQVISYPEVLGELVKNKYSIVVTGTHGKGTTSGLISYVLKNISDDSFFVGAVLTDLSTNFYSGKGERIVIEGDEYKSSDQDLKPKFYYYHPDLLLINNLEFDHPDLYPDLESIKKVFRELAEKLSASAKIVYNADDQNVLDVVKDTKAQKIGFGFNPNTQYHSKPPVLENGSFKLEIIAPSGGFSIKTQLPGKPYAYDNLAAAAVLSELGIAPEQFIPFFEKYSGVKRRYEVVFDQDITVIDDYAHHPSAVRETLEATREKYPNRRVVCFFEPHTFSRTKETLPELLNSFLAADKIFIAEVYPAREQKLPSSITGQEVVDAIKAKNPQLDVTLVANKKDALDKYLAIKEAGDVVIVMAVGSFNTLVNDLVISDHDKVL